MCSQLRDSKVEVSTTLEPRSWCVRAWGRAINNKSCVSKRWLCVHGLSFCKDYTTTCTRAFVFSRGLLSLSINIVFLYTSFSLNELLRILPLLLLPFETLSPNHIAWPRSGWQSTYMLRTLRRRSPVPINSINLSLFFRFFVYLCL